jgi:hypothetical protein
LTSDRRQRANRANAKSSTGPKTAAGKARAAQNAFRHGLNVPVLSDPLLAPEIEAMARRISGPYADGETVEWARRIAEAQFDLNRVRNSRRLLTWSTPTSCRGTSTDSGFGSCIWFSALVSATRLSGSRRSRRYLAACLPRAKKSLRPS